MKCGGHAGLNRFARIKEIAFVQDMRWAPFLGVHFAHDRQRQRFDAVEFLAQLL